MAKVKIDPNIIGYNMYDEIESVRNDEDALLHRYQELVCDNDSDLNFAGSIDSYKLFCAAMRVNLFIGASKDIIHTKFLYRLHINNVMRVGDIKYASESPIIESYIEEYHQLDEIYRIGLEKLNSKKENMVFCSGG